MKTRLLVVVMLLASAMVAGCHFASRNPPSAKVLQVSMDDVLRRNVITQSIDLDVGNTLTLKLGSNYTTPYRWKPDTKISEPSVLKQESHEFEQPTTDALGAPGTEVWTFDALKAGTATITTSYASIVGKDPKPTCTYTATVTVR